MESRRVQNSTHYEGQFDEVGEAVPARVYPWTAGLVGGVIGGTVMLLVLLIDGLVSGNGIWYPINLIAATLLRNLQEAPAALTQFDPVGLIIGLLLHYILSLVLGLLFAVLLPTLHGSPVLWAVLIGPLMWIVATYLVLPVLNPSMALLIDWPAFLIGNFLFSLMLGWWISRTPKIRAETP
ncbi:MAG: hypothetical protein HY326_04140 [Chloroflexi bacterium]|nr:hypothetical protein [Chloroflexota bacterium]